MERAEGRRRVEEADERMKRMRESQERETSERARQQRNESEPTDAKVPQTDQDVEDIGGDIDLEKWEKFQKSTGSKRLAERGEENQPKRQHSQESRGAKERTAGIKRSREEETTES
eukprot:12089388-Karenia_brevis.AAC.1